MPGFAASNFKALAVEPTEEELEQMRRDGMNPLTGDALAAAMLKSGPVKNGIDFSHYVPMFFMEPFLRLRQAKFILAEFERLGDMSYSKMITLRWMQRVDPKAESDFAERNK